MRALIVGDSAPASDIVALGTRTAGVTFEHCRNPDLAIERLRHAELAFDWLMLSTELSPGLRRCLGSAARRLYTGCIISVFGNDDAQDIDDPGDDLQQWRNVLTFATRAPEAFPAIRDAYRARPAMLQFHAPCKRTA